MELSLQREDWDIMLAHVRERAPLEACGLLVGKNNLVEKVLLIENQAQSPVRFRMDPQDQLEAFNWIDSSGLDLIGIFHSHPAGPDTVSATDIEEAAYSVAQIVWSRKKGRWTARGFWIQNQQVTEVKLKVIEDEQP